MSTADVQSAEATGMGETSGVPRWLDVFVYVGLLVTWALAPHSIKDAARACAASIVLFGVSRLVRPRRLTWHPLYRPVLLFLLVATLSTTFSSAPDWSWRRMAWFTLMLAIIVAAHTLRTRARILAMVAVLLASSSAILVRTGWQYTSGIGVRLVGLNTDNPLAERGFQPTDIIQTLNGRATRNPNQFRAALDATSSHPQVALGIARGAPIERVVMELTRRDFDAALHDRGLQIERGRPLRAQAGFYHYVPFAGFMTVSALLAWGLTLAAPSILGRAVLLAISLGATGAVAATLTRTYLAALLLGAFVAFWFVSRRTMRVVAVVAVVIAALAVTVWIRRERGLGWVASGDAGTQFRLEMWRDSVPLIVHHPLLGIGLDATFSGKWEIPAYRRFPLMSHFHSTPIQLAVDTGLPALAAWLWIAISFCRLMLRTHRGLGPDEAWMRGVVLGILGSAVAFYAAALVHYNQGDGEVMILLYVLTGIAVRVDLMTARAGGLKVAKSEVVESPTVSAA